MRRRLAAVTVVSALLLTTAACGDDSSDGGSADDGTTAAAPAASGDLEGVTATGDFGTLPDVEVETPLEVEDSAYTVLIEGDSDVVATAGKRVKFGFVVVNGRTGEAAESSYEINQLAEIQLDESTPQLAPFVAALEGQPVGTRVAVASPAESFYGAEGNAEAGIEPEDTVVFVIDLVTAEPTEVLDGPEGEEQDVPADLPDVVEGDEGVTGITFDDAPAEPSDELQVITLIEGEGPEIRKDAYVTFDYFGVVYGGDEPFDESYSREPATFSVGSGQLIQAWDEGLIGVPEGSRVMIIAPSDTAYGDQGTQGIPGGSTLVFVIDVLGVG